MRYLFLDTASSRVIVSIVQDSKILFYKDEENDNNLSNRIMVIVEDAFKSCNLKPADIDKIFVVNGPGSFTGIRCGVTVAKVMAHLLNVPVIPISELEVMCSGFEEKVCAFIDARRSYVYGGIYENLVNVKEDSYILYDDLVKDYSGIITSYEEGYVKPKIDVLKLIEKHKEESISVHKLVPNYLKLTEAEENLIKNS